MLIRYSTTMANTTIKKKKKHVPIVYRRLICSLSKQPKAYVRDVISRAKRPLVEALAESSLAVLRRTIKLSKYQARKLKKFKKTFDSLEKAKNLDQKKNAMLMQGGFLPLLIKVAAPFILGLLGKAV